MSVIFAFPTCSMPLLCAAFMPTRASVASMPIKLSGSTALPSWTGVT